MKSTRLNRCATFLLVWLPLGILSRPSSDAAARIEETFAVLQTRTGSYTNVTVTSKAKDWILILHSRGMCNIRIAELPADVQETLGYVVAPSSNAQGKRSTASMLPLKALSLPGMNQLHETWRDRAPAELQEMFSNPAMIWNFAVVAVLIYLGFCYCSMMICRKTHTATGILVWIPLLQMIPLLRAAGMSRMWLFAYLVPVVNLLAQLVWYVKIVEARGKKPLVVLWLLLPLTTPFAYLYLAFSEAAPVKFEREAPLVLETA